MKPPTLASNSRLISSSCASTASRPSSLKASTRSSTFTGSLLTNRIASMAARSSVGSIGICTHKAEWPAFSSAIEHLEPGLVHVALGSGYLDVTERISLAKGDPSETHELEHAEEDRDQLDAITAFQEPLQAERRLLPRLRIQLGHLVRGRVDGAPQLGGLPVVDLISRLRAAGSERE